MKARERHGLRGYQNEVLSGGWYGRQQKAMRWSPTTVVSEYFSRY